MGPLGWTLILILAGRGLPDAAAGFAKRLAPAHSPPRVARETTVPSLRISARAPERPIDHRIASHRQGDPVVRRVTEPSIAAAVRARAIPADREGRAEDPRRLHLKKKRIFIGR